MRTIYVVDTNLKQKSREKPTKWDNMKLCTIEV